MTLLKDFNDKEFNIRVLGALACKSLNARTCGVKLYYHTYPDID